MALLGNYGKPGCQPSHLVLLAEFLNRAGDGPGNQQRLYAGMIQHDHMMGTSPRNMEFRAELPAAE